MKHGRVTLAGVLMLVVELGMCGATGCQPAPASITSTPPAVLAVAMTRARMESLPIRVPASGSVVAWQESIVGAEAEGLRLVAIHVNVGDEVRQGQVLAEFNSDLVRADLAEATAAVAQAEAEALEAEANARRARELDRVHYISKQQAVQANVAATTARARVRAARAVESRQRLRLAHARVLAPGDGVISSRTATVGAVVPAAEELFRLIKDGRLEWHASIAAADLERLAPGQVAWLAVPGQPPVQGRLRAISPSISTQTRDGLAYVDLPRDQPLRAGAFARGYVDVGEGRALTLPRSAVLLRDGFHYVMQVGPASEVIMKKVEIGRRVEDRIEIRAGLGPSETVVASGLGFLSHGDTVRVVNTAPTRSAP